MARTLIFVLNDSITNSVFCGQVLEPLAHLQQRYQRIVLVSFERNPLTFEQQQHVTQRLGEHNFFVLKRLPFLGTLSLRYEAYLLKRLLKNFNDYDLMSRGPLAGWIALHAAQPQKISITVQARGLLSEEYLFAHAGYSRLMSYVHRFRAWQLLTIERYVYAYPSITIQAVSPALKDYLISHFKADSNHITIAADDIPQPISQEHKHEWRTQIRSQLGIPQSTHVYCYNGSVKAWQCPQETINYFKKQLTESPDSFLLVLTQDEQAFNKLLALAHIPPTHYHVRTVPHAQVNSYLCAADTGIIFRQPHILNWVSRPTKALEYTSAGLAIVHNNTVAWLNKD
jgi:hypothetical protein